MIRATWNQAKELGYCSEGMRRWLAGRGVTPLEYVQHGAPVDWLRAQDNAMAEKLADYAEAQAHGL